MKWLEKALTIQHNYFDTYHEFVPIKEDLQQIISEGIKLFLPLIAPYYDGKNWRNPYHGDDFTTVFKGGLDVAVSGLPLSYELFGDSHFVVPWVLISAANILALGIGYQQSINEEIDGKRKYSGIDGRTILGD